MAVRPIVDCYRENISVYNGKGLTKMQAKVSALMEAFERFSGERLERPTLLASMQEIRELAPVIDPRDLDLPHGATYKPEEKLEWVAGLELFSSQVRMVPACAAFCPYTPLEGAKSFNGFCNTNGLASGNTMGEAISQALAELIERDAQTLGQISRQAVTIDLESIQSPLIQSLVDKFRAAKIDLVLKEVISPVGIPTFFAAADEPATENPILLCFGMGTHVNAEIAAIRAITEVAQSRCTQISGNREDMLRQEFKKNWNYQSLKKHLAYWFEKNPPFKDFRSIPIVAHDNLVDDIQTMMRALKRKGFNEMIAINLTVGEIGVPAVRMIMPGLEHSMESGRFGKRARKLIKTEIV